MKKQTLLHLESEYTQVNPAAVAAPPLVKHSITHAFDFHGLVVTVLADDITHHVNCF